MRALGLTTGMVAALLAGACRSDAPTTPPPGAPTSWIAGFAELTNGVARHAVVWRDGTPTDLGTLGGNTSEASDVNGAGQVTGESRTAEGPDIVHAFLWQDGAMSDLGTLGGANSAAMAINDAGQIVGWASTHDVASGQEVAHAALWADGGISDLTELYGLAEARDINARGDIVGIGSRDDGSQAALLVRGGAATDVGTLGGPNALATGINTAGQVVGTSDLSDNGERHAFVWTNGTMTDLGTLGGLVSEAAAVNDAGQVVGHSQLAGGMTRHAFLWQSGVMTDLGTLPGGTESYASAISSDGVVVGSGTVTADPSGATHAFVWKEGVMTDLGTLGGPVSGARSIHLVR